MVIAGQEKSGKTTLACQAPGALLIPLEMGFQSMPVAKTRKLESFAEVQALTWEIEQQCKAGKIRPGQTIVWDSATALERLIGAHTIAADPKSRTQRQTMETAHGGYGKAYGFATGLFTEFLDRMDVLAFTYGLNIILTCHVFAARVVDPTSGEYDTWDLLLYSPKKGMGFGSRELITQWADFIGFLYEPSTVLKPDEGQRLSRAVSLNRGRMLGVARTPGYVAGNRYQMSDEIPIPLQQGWNYLAEGIYNNSPGKVDVYNRNP